MDWCNRAIRVLRQEGFDSLVFKIKRHIRERDRFRAWIRTQEANSAQLEEQRQTEFAYGPLISIVVPTYNTPRRLLVAMIESVRVQTYANWELCIADGGSQAPHVVPTLQSYQEQESRINLTYLAENRGIAENTNAAIGTASGDYIAFLDHDDELVPFALFEVVKALNEHLDADVLYSDEDKISQDGKRRFSPFFKPGFAPDSLRSHNYLCHFLVVKKALGDALGWLRKRFDGSQDYDLILRATERARRVVHIPKILYHWRVNPGSSAGDETAKTYAFDAAKQALTEHLDRIGLAGKVEEGPFQGSYHISYERSIDPIISILITNRDHGSDLRRCIESVLNRSNYTHLEILVIESGSVQRETFALYRELEQHPAVSVSAWEAPFNFAEINNFAAERCRGELLLFLHNHVEVINGDWLERMAEHALRSDIGAVSAKLYFSDNRIQHAGVVLGMGGVSGQAHYKSPGTSRGYFGNLLIVQNVSAGTAVCLMMRKAAFEEVGGFDPQFQLTHGDIDLCLKLRQKGFWNVWTPHAQLYLHEMRTRGHGKISEQRARLKNEVKLFKTKWRSVLAAGDPFFNPNFDLSRSDYSIKA